MQCFLDFDLFSKAAVIVTLTLCPYTLGNFTDSELSLLLFFLLHLRKTFLLLVEKCQKLGTCLYLFLVLY